MHSNVIKNKLTCNLNNLNYKWPVCSFPTVQKVVNLNTSVPASEAHLLVLCQFTVSDQAWTVMCCDNTNCSLSDCSLGRKFFPLTLDDVCSYLLKFLGSMKIICHSFLYTEIEQITNVLKKWQGRDVWKKQSWRELIVKQIDIWMECTVTVKGIRRDSVSKFMESVGKRGQFLFLSLKSKVHDVGTT
jgi:hypothetical protein